MAERLERRFGAHIEWLPYMLHPEYPPEGIPRDDLRRRYGDAFEDNLRRRFEQDDLIYNPPPEIASNTIPALRLTELARAQGKHDVVHDRLMVAYWEQAQDLGDPAVLRALADEMGLEGADAVIEGDLYADVVERETARAHSLGITGIPAYLLDNRLLVMGAQPDDVFEQAFAQLAAMAPLASDPQA